MGGSAAISKYVWCGDKLCQARDASYAATRSYFDEGEYAVRASVPGLFYGVDQIGSVRRVFESTTSAPAYDYDSWGVPLQTGTPLADFGFGGMIGHGQNGIWLATRRAYVRSTGRWATRDPFGEAGDQTGNLYNYVNGNPVSGLDPLGLWTLQIDFSTTFAYRGGAATGFAGVAFDDSGNSAVYYGGGLGAGIGTGGRIGVGAAVSNATCVSDLGGPFVNASTSAGAGENVMGDTFVGKQDNGKAIAGGGVSYGIGAGASTFVGATNTYVN